jgi:hypothetical protein
MRDRIVGVEESGEQKSFSSYSEIIMSSIEICTASIHRFASECLTGT